MCDGTCSESCHECLEIRKERRKKNKFIDANEKGSVACLYIGQGLKLEAEYEYSKASKENFYKRRN